MAGLSGNGVLGLIGLCAYIFPGGMDQGVIIRERGLLYVIWNEPSSGLFIPKDPRAPFFPPDTPGERVDWAVARLGPQSMAANLGMVPPQVWEGDDDGGYRGRLGYVRCTGDAIIPVAQQDGMLAAAGGRGKWVIRTLEG